ncbi:hypothetical protein BGZ81_011681 [Podila clonocystis]|nr:hypothetical protein BGZ81_011681 [Podila clonocystis]
MSSSASTIRPVQPSSPSPSIRNAESNYSSTILANRGPGASTGTGAGTGGPPPSQPRSTRGSQLFGIASHDRDKRAISVTNSIMQQLQGTTSPRDEAGLQRIQEPAHPFHHGTLSASLQKSGFLEQAFKQSSPYYGTQSSTRTSPRSQHSGLEQPVYPTSGYQDNDRSSTISSASTPYSQSNSVSQIFEETSFFNQLSSNDSLSRGGGAQGGHPISRSPFQESSASSPFSAGAPPPGSQGRFGLGFVETTLQDTTSNHQGSFMQNNMGASSQRTTNMHRSILKTADDNDTETSTDKDDDDEEVTSQDESEPLRQQIKQLHLEDVLAFLPIGGSSASGVLPETGKRQDTRDEAQRRTVLGDKMPFQLDAELADLGTRPLEEILNHNDDDGDMGEEDDHGHGYNGRGDRAGMSSAHGNVTRTSPERSGPSSRKSSAQNSVGSSFSDLSDSSVTQSAMEDAYLSGYNNSKL